MRLLLAILGNGLLAAGSVAAAVPEPGIPAYQPVPGISGNLSSAGSDTLANLMILWGEEFSRFYPAVNLQIQAAGSSTASPALTESTANIGPVSRELKDNEIAAFETRYGYQPTAVPVAIDALAVFVHRDNPLPGLTLGQLDAMFSATRRCGHARAINAWSELGLGGSWQTLPVQLFGRNSVSGTYGFFKEVVLCGGDFSNTVNEQPGSASVVQAVGASIRGIGYAGIGYRTSNVRTVPLATDTGGPLVAATAENAVTGRYPLARLLYIYINKEPNRNLPPLEREFLALILSRDGQAVVQRDGYIPLPGSVIASARRDLGL